MLAYCPPPPRTPRHDIITSSWPGIILMNFLLSHLPSIKFSFRKIHIFYAAAPLPAFFYGDVFTSSWVAEDQATVKIIYEYGNHRADRLPGFFSGRPNWDPPPLTTSRVWRRPLPLWLRGEGNIRLVESGCEGGVPIRTRGKTLWYSRYICTLLRKQYVSVVCSQL